MVDGNTNSKAGALFFIAAGIYNPSDPALFSSKSLPSLM
jgi:hypothetical protein